MLSYARQKSDNKSRSQCSFLLTVFVCGCFMLFFLYNSADFLYKRDNKASLAKRFKQLKYLVRTEGCTIPAMEPLNDNIQEFIVRPKNIKPCKKSEYPLLENNRTHIWVTHSVKVLNYYNITNRKRVVCCYVNFYRPMSINIARDHPDNMIKYNTCKIFREVTDIEADGEFVRVLCFTKKLTIFYQNFYLLAPKKQMSLNAMQKRLHKKTLFNVLVLGIDNVSRLNFHRTMPKTAEFFLRNGGVEMLGYNKVGDNSFPNLVALLLGYSQSELSTTCHPLDSNTFDSCPFIWYRYKNAGYYTAFGEDSAYLGTFNYLEPGFLRYPTDYYMRPFAFEAEKVVGNNKIYNAKLCLNGDLYYKILLNYIEDITNAVRPSPLFGFFWEVSMTHDDLNFPMLIDESYEIFFKSLQSSKYLNNTIIVLMSDHGIRWGPIRNTRQGYFEDRLPLAYILTPKSFQATYKKAFSNLRRNSRSLTTPFDLHETLLDIINLDNLNDEKIGERTKMSYAHKRGISMFLSIPDNRTCNSAGIADHWCSCHRSISVPKQNTDVVESSKFLLKYLNSLLADYTKCAELTLDEIVKSEEVVADVSNEINNLKSTWKELILIVRTRPSQGIFESTLRATNGSDWSVVGSVSRLNMYGNQSLCVNDPQIRPYCYCKL